MALKAFTPKLVDALAEQESATWAAKLPTLQRSLDDARTYLYMRHCFFGRLVMKMKCVFTESVDTAAVRADAVCYLNPDFWEGLDAAERSFLLAHELCHLAYLHFHRLSKKNPRLWNEAGDHMINNMLQKAGMKLPSRPDLRGLCDPKYAGMADEEIYAILWKEFKEELAKGGQCPECGQGQPQPGQGQPGQGQPGQGQGQPSQGQGQGAPDPNGQPQPGGGGGGQPDPNAPPDPHGGHDDNCPTCGQKKPQQSTDGKGFGKSSGDCDFGATQELEQKQGKDGAGQKVLSPAQWKGILIQAAQSTQASGRGDLPSDMQRWIDTLKDPQVNWIEYLRRLTSQAIYRGTSYRRPSRHSGALSAVEGLPTAGIMLPAQKTSHPPVVIAIDSSGSRGNKEIGDDLAETFALLKLYPGVPIRAIVCDAAIQSDQMVRRVEDIKIGGGGGTRSEPVFELLEKDIGRKKPQCLIYFTDMAITFPEKRPRYPVFWVYMGNGEPPTQPPFGILIKRPIDVSNFVQDPAAYVAQHPTAVAAPAPVAAIAAPVAPAPPPRPALRR